MGLVATINGTSGNDTLNGTLGDDIITGGGGTDLLNGNDGSDIYMINAASEHPAAEIRDTGGSGLDEVRSATTAQTLALFAGDTKSADRDRHGNRLFCRDHGHSSYEH